MSILFKINSTDLVKKKQCLVCDNNKFKIISKIYYKNDLLFFSTAVCNNCGLIFRNVHPKNAWFSLQYQKRSLFQVKKNKGVNLEYEKLRIFRYKQLYNFLKNKINFKNLLDIGCATGLGLKIFKDSNVNIFGIDNDKTRIEYGKKKGLNLKHKDIFSLNEKRKFDLIICLHTLEHLTNPQKAIKKILNFTHHKSYIYIEVPNFKNLVRKWDDAIYLAHISNFTESNLIYFLKKNKLEIIYKTYPQTENGEYNLGFLCKIKKNINLKGFRFKKININKYSINKPYKNIIIPFKVNLNEINDISFKYKLKKKLQKKNILNHNFRRALIFDKKIKKYVIEEKYHPYNEKKLKFLKNLKYVKVNEK